MSTLVAMAMVVKNSTDISYKTTEPILQKFHITPLYDSYIKFSLKGHYQKFKMVAMPIYGNKN